jgi:hypothetical protein
MRYETIIQLDDVDIDVICEWDREYIGWMEISQLSIAGIKQHFTTYNLELMNEIRRIKLNQVNK